MNEEILSLVSLIMQNDGILIIKVQMNECLMNHLISVIFCVIKKIIAI